MSDRLTIGQRINEVRKEVAYLKREKSTPHGKAVEHDQVTGAIRQALIDHGIITIVTELESELRDANKQTQKGVPITAFIAKYQIDFCCIDELKDRVSTVFTSIGEDFGDKGPGKAASYAVKTAMLKTFNIETGESDESRTEQEPKSINQDQISNIELFKKTADADEEKFKKYLKSTFGAGRLEDLTKKQGDMVLRTLRDKIERGQSKSEDKKDA